MNGFILLLPFFFIRFVVLAFLDKASLQRAAMFAPLKGNEKPAYYIYQLTNAGIILYPFFLTVKARIPAAFWYCSLGVKRLTATSEAGCCRVFPRPLKALTT